ncbi:DUF4112 domain-containing protein [Thalassolituus maritimus]|uniref:DUF4112 domain-containing protein n=1 Tax=Thalassolituus maritimus TaxID=484498 RepID=A0ABP9ZWU7_9GAMM
MATPDDIRRLKRVDAFARMLDAQFRIPFTRFSIGVDGIIGLIPGIGDGASFLLALYPVVMAHRCGAGIGLKSRMLFNILIDTVIGSIPLVGDLFDIGFKANLRNAELLRKFVEKT